MNVDVLFALHINIRCSGCIVVKVGMAFENEVAMLCCIDALMSWHLIVKGIVFEDEPVDILFSRASMR